MQVREQTENVDFDADIGDIRNSSRGNECQRLEEIKEIGWINEWMVACMLSHVSIKYKKSVWRKDEDIEWMNDWYRPKLFSVVG